MKKQTDEDKLFYENLDKLIECRIKSCRKQTNQVIKARLKFRRTKEKECGTSLQNPDYFACRGPEPAAITRREAKAKACMLDKCRTYYLKNEALIKKEKRKTRRHKKAPKN